MAHSPSTSSRDGWKDHCGVGWQGIVNQSFLFTNDFVTELLGDIGFEVIVGPFDRPDLSIEAAAQIEADHILVMPSGDNTLAAAQQQ